MTDAHCHVTGGDPSVREFLIGRDFVGIHPWETLPQLGTDPRKVNVALDEMRLALEKDRRLGIGEIGLDRLRERDISPRMREVFEAQLKLAFEFRRPVVLHGAKCWGQVVEALKRGVEKRCRCRMDGTPTPFSYTYSFLFHGFSRSDGLIPDIVKLNGYISVGPAVLNDHAVNYRELVKKIPLERLLLETDRTAENAADCPSVREVAVKVAALRGLSVDELETLTDANAVRFFAPIGNHGNAESV